MRRQTTGRTVVLGLALTLALGVPAAAQSRGSVGGEVVDGAGNGIRGLTLRFTPDDGSAATEVQTKKNGRFFERLSGGRYTLDLPGSELFILSIDYVAKDEAGLVLSEGRLEGDPSGGVRGLPLSGQNAVDLTVTVADKGSDLARQRQLAFALPELTAAADLYNAGKYEEAAAEARKVMDARPELGEGYYVYGVSLDRLGRLAEADSALTQAVALIPDQPGIWGALGEVRMKQAVALEEAGVADAKARFAQAAEALTQALASDPDSLPVQLNLAGCLDRTGDTAQLAPLIERILAQDPGQLQWRLRLASIRSQRGDQAGAMELLREIPAGEKQAAVTLFNIAVRADEEGDTDSALLLARRAVEIDPALPHARQLVAQLLLAKGEMEEAKAAIRAFLEIAPDGPDAETYRNILQQLESQ